MFSPQIRRFVLFIFLIFSAVLSVAHDEPLCSPGTTSPSVTICSPRNGSTVTNPVAIAAVTTSSTPVTTMKVYVDGDEKFRTSGGQFHTHMTLPTGKRTITVNAWNAEGGFRSTSVVTVQNATACQPNTANPSVTICTPLNGSTVTSPVHVVALTTSSLPVSTMRIYVDYSPVYTVRSNKIDTFLTLSPGTRRLEVKAWNSSGSFSQQIKVNVTGSAVPYKTQVFLSGLNFPVAMAFAPDGRLFYNELQTGKIRVVKSGGLQSTPFATIPILTGGERGLIGIAFDPQFASNRFLYVFHTAPSGKNRITRLTDWNGAGVDAKVIVDNLPAAQFHNAGNIGFGADGKLYISIGDNGTSSNAQSKSSLAGKILRYNRDGSIPLDNPFGSGVAAFNLGLRNSFDFTFHPQSGRIYATENGPHCDDEINRIVPGGNYGWRPDYPCGDSDSRFIAPITRFNPVIAPTGTTFYTRSVFPQFKGKLLVADFNQGKIRAFTVDESQSGRVVDSQTVLNGGFGSLLDIVQGPDGYLYFSSPTAIMRIVPQ
jgi:glucose/arabinose dehydrogenase